MDTLTERDFVKAAFILECEIAAIKAVCEVEAPNGGFAKSGNPTILFEGHIFHRYSKGRFTEKHPTLSYPKWTRAHYAKTQDGEWVRLQAAMRLDETAALMSASWGKFQIMGFNFALCGYKSVEEFVEAMQESEAKQLDAFVQYILATGLQDELQARDWPKFARYYNGPEYKKNRYDTKLAKAFTKYRELA